MDVETLANHIRSLGKHDFDRVCRLILSHHFNKEPINIDGKNDGGTDFIELDSSGKRKRVAYQLTVQKEYFDKKFFNDARKALKKLGVGKFYYLTSNPISETTSREWENQMEDELGIPCCCFGCRVIAEMLLQYGLANEALVEIAGRIPIDLNLDRVEMRERMLHAYTLLSSDARNMRESIYDDTIMMEIGADDEPLSRDDIVDRVKLHLSLNDYRDEVLFGRIDSLLSRGKLYQEKSSGLICLAETTKKEIEARKRLYDADLASMVSAQTDLMNEQGIEWSVEDSRKISLWLASKFIHTQISILKESKSELVLHPLFKYADKDKSLTRLVNYLVTEKGMTVERAKSLTDDLQKLAATDPLIKKITRASMYLALEGTNPMYSSRALGAKNWSDFDLLIDASVALPCICHALYNNYDYGHAADAIKAVHRAQELSIRPRITYFYIKECAGHLLAALDYLHIELSDNEMQYSSNAFVAHYFGMKVKGNRVPDTLDEFLYSFSASLKSQYKDRKSHIRALMIDIQEKLKDEGVFFESVQMFDTEQCDVYHDYVEIVSRLEPDKRPSLVNHDTWALQHVMDSTNRDNAHWLFLTYDRTLRQFGRQTNTSIWISKPSSFLDMVESTQDLSESDLQNMVHLIATSSESTLSMGARMMDKILEYASPNMQNVDFQADFRRYKREALSNFDPNIVNDKDRANELVDKLVDDYLRAKGIVKNNIEVKDDEDDFARAKGGVS